MMNNYDRRWFFVLNWARNVQARLAEGYFIWDGETSFEKADLIIAETNRYIALRSGCAQFMIFEGNLQFDHGAYTPITELRQRLEEYKLLKPCAADLFAPTVYSPTQDLKAKEAYAAFDRLHSTTSG